MFPVSFLPISNIAEITFDQSNRRNFCPNKLFGKLPGRPAKVLKKNSAMDVLMGSLTPQIASDWMNRKSQRNE